MSKVLKFLSDSSQEDIFVDDLRSAKESGELDIIQRPTFYFDSLDDYTKSEMCMLCELNNNTWPSNVPLNFKGNKYKHNAYLLTGDEKYRGNITDVDDNLYDSEYIRGRISQIRPTYYRDYNRNSILWLILQVLFDTDFGRRPSFYSSFILRFYFIPVLKDYSNNNYWPNDFMQQMYFVSLCGIALKCLGSDLDTPRKTELQLLDNAIVDSSNFRRMAFYEIYQGMR